MKIPASSIQLSTAGVEKRSLTSPTLGARGNPERTVELSSHMVLYG